MIIPWQVDVPQDRLPFINWLIIAGAVTAFVFQNISIYQRSLNLDNVHQEYASRSIEDVVKEFSVEEQHLKQIRTKADRMFEDMPNDPNGQYKKEFIKETIIDEYYTWGRIRPFILNGFSIKGLFGHLWLHGGILHIAGNMLFLWIFGNAVCSKIGNISYLPVYLGLGLISGISHLLFTGGAAIGASGAINGIVGMYLVFFPTNEITCYFVFLLFFRPIVKEFCLSSYWMILFWLMLDIWGAMSGEGQVAYYAHLGGFVGGFGLGLLMLKLKLVKMYSDETSIVQAFGDWRNPPKQDNSPHYEGYLSVLHQEIEQQPQMTVKDAFDDKPIPFDNSPPTEPAKDTLIRFSCSCGKRFKVPPSLAGKMGKCPKCNARMKIPDK